MSAKKKSSKKVAKQAKATKKTAKVAKTKPSAKKAAPKKIAARKAAPKKAAAKKVAAPKRAASAKPLAKKPAAKGKAAKKPAVKRRDGSGHLDPKYAADLRALSRGKQKDNNRAFDSDALSKELGEEFVETVTSGEDEGNEVRDQRVTEELGGPFTVTSAGTEFADAPDASNPKGASREPFPRT